MCTLDAATMQSLDATLAASITRAAFHLHAWFPGDSFGHVVTHWMPIGNFDGPHPFFAGDGALL
jgi:hypothetical protein